MRPCNPNTKSTGRPGNWTPAPPVRTVSQSPEPPRQVYECTYRHTLWRSGRGIIIVFLSPTPVTQFQRDPLSGGHKYTGSGRNCDFWPKSLFVSETYGIGPWLLWITNRKSQVADRPVPVPMTPSDLEKGQIFPADLCNYAHTVNDHIWQANTCGGEAYF